MNKILHKLVIILSTLLLCAFATIFASASSNYSYYSDSRFPDFGDFASCEADGPYAYETGERTWYYSFDYADELLEYRDYLIELGFDVIRYEDEYDVDGMRHNIIMDIENNQSIHLWSSKADADLDAWANVDVIDHNVHKNQDLSVSTNVINTKVSDGTQAIEVTSYFDSEAWGLRYVLDNNDVVEAAWDEQWNNDKINLNIAPKKAGIAHAIIYGLNTGEIQKVTINVSGGTKKATKKLPSATTYKASPGLGKGTWKTSNSSIVSLSQKKGSTCTFKLKKAGKAKVTFKSDLGTYVYNITVYNKKSDPIRAGFIEMDSANSIEPTIFIANNSSKTIKYVDFNATFYNAVGDKVRNEIGNNYTKALQIVGPIKPWTMDYFEWDPVFYSPVVKRMYVKSATITYMDGSKKTVSIRKSFTYSKKDANKYYKYI